MKQALLAFRLFLLVCGVALAILLTSCGSSGQAATPGAMPPPAVSTVTLGVQDASVIREYAAQTFARNMVEVRARVDGYLESRPFEVGSDVRKGQPLYVLDLRPYDAAVKKARAEVVESRANAEFATKQVSLLQAEANLAQAKANLLKAQQDVKRLTPLVAEDAASRQDLDNAQAALEANLANVKAQEAAVEQARLNTTAQIQTAEAQVQANEAALRTAELNLEYATIRAPIDGRVGDSTVQVGGLVSATGQTALTTIMPLDVIWVRFQLSETEYLEYEKRRTNSPTQSIPLTLVLANGQIHPHPGRIQNANNQIDPRTGTLELQATFPNPGHRLLPGQFGRIRMAIETRSNALLIPQIAVTDRQGEQTVYTIGEDNKAQLRNIVAKERIGNSFLVSQGLKPGDRLVVEGIQKVRPGAPVTPSPYTPNPADAQELAKPDASSGAAAGKQGAE